MPTGDIPNGALKLWPKREVSSLGVTSPVRIAGIKRVSIGGHRAFCAGATIQILPGKMRNAAARAGAQIIKRGEIGIYLHRQFVSDCAALGKRRDGARKKGGNIA
jgi:hypothetical protein